MGTFTTTEPYPKDFVPQLLTDTWRRHQAGEKPGEVGPDGFPVYPENPLRAEHSLLSKFIDETREQIFTEIVPKNFASGREILALEDAARVRVVFASLQRLPWFWKTGVRQTRNGWFGKGWEYDDPLFRWNLQPLMAAILRSPVPFTPDEFGSLMVTLLEPPHNELLDFVPAKTVVRQVQSLWKGVIPETVLAALRSLQALRVN